MKYLQLYFVPSLVVWFVLGATWYHDVIVLTALVLGLVAGSMWGEGLRRYQITQ